MRRIDARPLNNRDWNQWIEDCRADTQEYIEEFEKGNRPRFKNTYKRKKIKTDYFLGKEAPFFGKCAYCECHIADYQHGDVEHFRPKGGVKDENNNPVYLQDEHGDYVLNEKNNPITHPGYYWLAYDWHNLLPSCTRCNQLKKINGKMIGKKNCFPVIGKHAQNLEETVNERPLLINPASSKPEDDPEIHLTINTSNGLILPLTERGKMCIKIFGLSIRDQLLEDRKIVCQQVAGLLARIIDLDYTEDDLADIKKVMEGRSPFNLAGRTVIKESNIENIIEE